MFIFDPAATSLKNIEETISYLDVNEHIIELFIEAAILFDELEQFGTKALENWDGKVILIRAELETGFLNVRLKVIDVF